MGIDANELGGMLGALGILVLAFLVVRGILLWCWRVNEAIALLKSIDDKLGILVKGTAQ